MDKLAEECTESVKEVELAKITLVFKMKISKKVNAILEHCRSYYFQLSLQLTLELVPIFLIAIGTWFSLLVLSFGTYTQTTI